MARYTPSHACNCLKIRLLRRSHRPQTVMCPKSINAFLFRRTRFLLEVLTFRILGTFSISVFESPAVFTWKLVVFGPPPPPSAESSQGLILAAATSHPPKARQLCIRKPKLAPKMAPSEFGSASRTGQLIQHLVSARFPGAKHAQI